MNFQERRAYYQGAYPVTVAGLKIVAYTSMLIDHAASGLLNNYIKTLEDPSFYKPLYDMLRHIGRLAFPIFCFLIAEGMVHTKSKSKYLLRIFLFMLLSELPYDFALGDGLIDWKDQNVFVTLLLGALCVCCIRWMEKYVKNKILFGIGTVTFSLFFSALNLFFKSDYKEWGVLLIVAFYLCRNNYLLMLAMSLFMMMPGYTLHAYIATPYYDRFTLAGYLTNPKVYEVIFFSEAYGILSVFLMYFYRGEKGNCFPKYCYYFFYPGHLLIIGLIRHFLF